MAIGGNRCNLSAQRSYPAAPATVWASITDPAALGRWFAAVDLAGDGSWRAVFTNGAASGTVQTCHEGREIVTSWTWEHETSASVVRVTLEPDGDRTLLRVTQRGVSSDAATGYGAGWYAMLGGLAIHLDGRQPTDADWDADFALARRTMSV